MIARVDQACGAGARLSKACQVLEISPRTLQCWREGGGIKADGRKEAYAKRTPANKHGETERQKILDLVSEPEFAHLPPSQIVLNPTQSGDSRNGSLFRHTILAHCPFIQQAG